MSKKYWILLVLSASIIACEKEKEPVADNYKDGTAIATGFGDEQPDDDTNQDNGIFVRMILP